MGNVNNLIAQIKSERKKFNLDIPKPIETTLINDFINHYKDIFKVELTPNYLSFLKICDGLVENGFTIYSSYDHTIKKVEYGIFENNETWADINPNLKFIYFGESDQDLYAYNKVSKEYEVLDRYSSDVCESFDNFELLLEHILEKMLNT